MTRNLKTKQIIEQRDALEGPPNNIEPINLLLTDPPYGTGKTQTQQSNAYYDSAEIGATIESIVRWMPAMHPNGTIAIICDYRLAPHITTAIIDNGWSYRGEIIWTFGLGRPRTNWWPVRHNNILTFTRTPTSGQFNRTAIPKEPRRAPKPGYPSDKPAGSVWDYTMSNTDPERVGYPNQKPLAIIEPIVLVHTNPNDLIADPFIGSGTTANAAKRNNRNFYGCDTNPEAVAIATQRLSKLETHKLF